MQIIHLFCKWVVKLADTVLYENLLMLLLNETLMLFFEKNLNQ